jgi:hypothetical protein
VIEEGNGSIESGIENLKISAAKAKAAAAKPRFFILKENGGVAMSKANIENEKPGGVMSRRAKQRHRKRQAKAKMSAAGGYHAANNLATTIRRGGGVEMA